MFRAMFRATPWSIGPPRDESQAYDAFARHTSLGAPVDLMPGLHDHADLPSVFAAWCEALVAPRKEAIWCETAGHMVPAEDPAAFNRDVVRIVRDAGLIGG